MRALAFRNKRNQRGAAMVEGAIIVGVLVVCWGVMATAYAAGRAKLEAQTTARVDVMYYATNECKSAYRPEGRIIEGSQAGQLGDASGELAANAPVGGDSASARSSFFFASSSATVTSTFLNRARTAQSRSWAVCNEGAYDGDVAGMFAYLKDLFVDFLPGPIKGALQ